MYSTRSPTVCGLPFIWKIPYKDFCLFLPQDKDFVVKNLLKIVAEKDKMEKYLLKMRLYRDDVSWSSESSRVVSNIIYEANARCQ